MKFITMLLLALSVTMFSCSKEKVAEAVNDAKIKTADTMGAAVEKELKEAYGDMSVGEVNCQDEAVKLGGLTSEKVKEFLKVKQEEQSMARSAVGSLVPIVCNYIITDIFPEQLAKVDTEYVCLKQLGQDKITKVGKDLCSAIDL